uniref:Uncharacterized protein n=1 Tax=Salvator merianae TaxID=96440 RepID=A0A8D0C8I0_SALMN
SPQTLEQPTSESSLGAYFISWRLWMKKNLSSIVEDSLCADTPTILNRFLSVLIFSLQINSCIHVMQNGHLKFPWGLMKKGTSLSLPHRLPW